MKVIKNNKLIFAICFLGFLVRSVYILFFNRGFTWPDEDRYWYEIIHFTESWTFSCGTKYAHDMPLTAIMLSMFVKFTGMGIIGVKLFLAFISSCTIFVISKIAYELSQLHSSIWVAGLAAAFYPFFIYYSSLILSETIFLFLISLFFWQIIRGTNKACIYSGLTAGLLHLTRPTVLYFLPIVWVWQYYKTRISIKSILLSIAVLAIVILPWGIRNYFVLGKFHLGSSGSGQALWEGNNPWNKDGGVSEPNWEYLKDMPKGLNELEEDNWKKKKAIKYIIDNPSQFIKLAIKKFARFWNILPNVSGYNQGLFRWISIISFGPLILLTLTSLWGLSNKWNKTGIIWLFIVYYTMLHIVTIGSLRYRLPLEPLMIALSSAFLSTITLSKKKDRV